jgi:hypothetical protein
MLGKNLIRAEVDLESALPENRLMMFDISIAAMRCPFGGNS